MLERRFACDAGVARVSCRATHLAASHASSGHPPPLTCCCQATSVVTVFFFFFVFFRTRGQQHFAALEGGCGGRLLVLVSVNHLLSSLSSSLEHALEVTQSLVALLVDSDFAWELRNILLFFCGSSSSSCRSVSQKKSFISLVLGRL